MNKFRNVVGIILVLLGVLLGLKAFDIIDINIFFKGWWTLLIIIPGIFDLFKENERISGSIKVLIGVVLLLVCQNIIDFSLVGKLILPLILIFVGISFISKNIVRTKIAKEMDNIDKTTMTKDHIYAIFSTKKLEPNSSKINHFDLTAVFGEINLDLENLSIKGDIIINTNIIFGTIKLTVPEGYSVKVKSTSLFGDVSNNKKNKDNKNIIYIDNMTFFGEVKVK